MGLWHTVIELFLPLELLLLTLISGQEVHVVWYVAPGGSTNASSCGRVQDNPCASLEVVFSQSELFIVEQGCVSSSGDNDGRLSTTVFFMEGKNFVPSTCLKDWTDLRIVGIGNVMINSSLGGYRGLFEFRNCSNVSIESIHFTTVFTGRAVLFFEESRDISIIDCVIPVTSLAGTGIYFHSCAETVNITNSRIFGDPSFSERQNPATGIVISQGDSFTTVGPLDGEGMYFQADFFISNCTFTGIADGGMSSTSYPSSWGSAVGLLGVFHSSAQDNTIIVQNCTFSDLVNTRGSSALLRFEKGASGNTAHFVGSTFANNIALYGGGIAVYFVSSETNLIEIDGCSFINNRASFEGGGLHVVSLSVQPSDSVHVRNSVFKLNEADYGAAVFLFSDPTWYSRAFPSNDTSLPLMTVEMEACVIMNSSATVNEAALNTLRVKLLLSGNNVFTGNNGSAVLLRSSVLVASGILSFTHNKAMNGAAMKILDMSRVNFKQVTKAIFQFNEVLFSGGAVYADKASTTVTSNEYNHTLTANVLGVCFMEVANSFLPRFRFIFSNNTALRYGNDMFIYSLRSCEFQYFLPSITTQFLTIQNDNTTTFDVDDPLGATSTGPSFLFFYGASTRCYKPVGNVTFLLPNCSHELLMSHFYTLSELQCGLSRFLDELDRSYSGPGAQLHPTVEKLILPWSGIETSWTEPVGSIRQTCTEPSPGALLLSPAPGEKFDLTVQLGDQLLNYITETVYIEVAHVPLVSPGVLMQLNGIQFAYTDRIYFTPNRVLSGLALVGLPGTEGKLLVVSESQIEGRDIVLEIPFKLAPCNLGYYNPIATTVEEVNQLIITNYSFTMRVPAKQLLSCVCYSRTNTSLDWLADLLLPTCIDGYTVQLDSLLWAGYLPVNGLSTVDELETSMCPSASNSTDPNKLDRYSAWMVQERNFQMERAGSGSNPAANPVDVQPYFGVVIPGGGAPVRCYLGYNMSYLVEYKPNAVFSVDVCTRGYCQTDSTSWFLSDVDYPCVENRQGPLCGQCKPGLALTLTTTLCRDCSNPLWYIPLFTTLIIGLLLVVFVVAFNLGVYPTLDSLLFFIQAVYIVVSGRIGYSSFQGLGFFNLDFTFDLCLTSNLDALQRLVLQYVTPMYLVTLLAGVVCLTKVKGISKYLGQHSYLHGIWLIILVSYLNVANSSFEILHCRLIGPDSDERLVLVYDAAIHCWAGAHLPWALLAVFLVTLLILPFPIYVGIAIKFPKLKPITDVYTSVYRDRQRYWVIYNIFRRLLIVVIGVFSLNFIFRHELLLFASLFLLLIFILTWPYRSAIDNYFAAIVSLALVLFLVVTEPTLTSIIDPYRAVSWIIVATVIKMGVVLLIIEFTLLLYSRKKRIQRMTMDDLYADVCRPKLVNWLGAVAVKCDFRRHNHKKAFELGGVGITAERSTYRNSVSLSTYREPLLDSEPIVIENAPMHKTVEQYEPVNDRQINSVPGDRNSTSTIVSLSEI